MDGSWKGTRARSNETLEAAGFKPAQNCRRPPKCLQRDWPGLFGLLTQVSRKECGGRKLVLGGRVTWSP